MDHEISQRFQRTTISFKQAEDLIINRAKQLVNLLIKTRGHDRSPFLSIEYANLLGIKQIVKVDLGKLGGALLTLHDGYIIKINQNHPQSRQNFSCAHEIGHVLLNDINQKTFLQPVEFRYSNPQAHLKADIENKERLCNIAATELLMPEDIFKRHLVNHKISINTLEQLAKAFSTSLQTTAIRLAETNIKPCAVLLWHLQQHVNSKSLKLDWHVGPGKRSSTSNQYLPMNRIAGPSSTVYQAFQNNDITKCYKQFRTQSGIQYLQIESKGYGIYPERYVISLVLPTNN